jgi:hypothetical protein
MFTSVGCVIAGAQRFERGFGWDDLVNLPAGSEIFWKIPGSKTRYEGVVLESPVLAGQEMVRVRVEKGGVRERGIVWSFSPQKFTECIFSEACLPSRQGSQVMENAFAFIQSVGVSVKRSWLWSAEIEVSLRTNMTRFWSAIDGLALGVSDAAPCPAGDALFPSTTDDKRGGKAQVASSTRASERSSPVHILDGLDAFHHVRDIGSGNVVVILDRTEYTPEVNNFLLSARSFSRDPSPELLETVPERFPPGFELSAYVLPGK